MDGEPQCDEPGARHLVVDAMNVIGSRPDGWWRDRDGAIAGFVARLAASAEARDRPVHVVVDGRPVAGATDEDVDGVHVLYAARRGPNAADDRIVALLDELEGDVTVVTADRELRRRVTERGANVIGPMTLLDRLDEAGAGD